MISGSVISTSNRENIYIEDRFFGARLGVRKARLHTRLARLFWIRFIDSIKGTLPDNFGK